VRKEMLSSLGSSAVQVDRLLPELVDVGEDWHTANHSNSSCTHPHCQLIYLAEGTLSIGIRNGAEIVLRPCSFISIPANFSHRSKYGSEDKHHVFWVCFHLKDIETRHPGCRLFEHLNRLNVAHNAVLMERYFIQVFREATTPNVYQASALRLALDSLVLEVVRTVVVPKELTFLTPHPAITKALNILETRFGEDWKLHQLSKEVGLSQSRLAELFNRQTGASIHQFLIRIRVQRAETLLTQSNLTVGQVGHQCGFTSIQHFSRVFTKITGEAPIQYRRRYSSAQPLVQT
jgi:AraC-like DNA-binding protein